MKIISRTGWPHVTRRHRANVTRCYSRLPVARFSRPIGLAKKVEFFQTRYRALGPEMIPGDYISHAFGGIAIAFRQACGYLRSFHQIAPYGSTHPIPVYYSFIDRERMKDGVGQRQTFYLCATQPTIWGLCLLPSPNRVRSGHHWPQNIFWVYWASGIKQN